MGAGGWVYAKKARPPKQSPIGVGWGLCPEAIILSSAALFSPFASAAAIHDAIAFVGLIAPHTARRLIGAPLTTLLTVSL
ncbi:hypothetical protein [Desulfosarcina sp.]|uniref:hypothetical protein n=1 Tax=Desulfosarcina sp. TaxID=2027861 RepID=UPI003970530A